MRDEINRIDKEPFDLYQRLSALTAIYPKEKGIEYTTLGLVGEAGEIANKVKKFLRGDGELDKQALLHELGDVLWYVSQLSKEMGINLSDVAISNVKKLQTRMIKCNIMGDGDNR